MPTSTLKHSLRAVALLASSTVTSSCSAQVSPPAPQSQGTLVQTDFETGSGWLQNAPSAVGTVDIAGSTQPSLGLKSNQALSSGLLPVKNSETNLGKLTLAFNLSTSSNRPVTVRVESFDQNKKRTGGLESLIYPAAPDFYQRFALDLSTMKPVGAGKFQPANPFVQFTFVLDSGKGSNDNLELRLDNLQYAKPAFYVSQSGSDKNDGRTEQSAFATPQKALDMAGPGDIVVVMNGTYQPVSKQDGIAAFRHPGTPSGWISLKNYPSHSPLFQLVNAWAAVRIGRPASSIPADDNTPALAYLEVRGLHIRGEGDQAKQKYPEAIGQPDPRINGSGIQADVRAERNKSHHLRFADNLVEYCPGAGIAPNEADWVTIENNIARNNCWTTMYGTSGISINGGSNFDGTSGGYRMLIRNNITSGNRTFEPWAAVKKISDGNGIIIDINQNDKLAPEQRFSGRTLIQNNLSFNNGGSGIHTLKSKRVDIINNTAYMNGASPELRWGQIFLQHTDDARVINNILWSREGQAINTVTKNSNDKQNTNVLRANNLLFGGVEAIIGENDLVANPQFVNASDDATVANFHLKPSSPAIGAGRLMPFSPFLDLDGKPRGVNPTIGAYQFP